MQESCRNFPWPRPRNQEEAPSYVDMQKNDRKHCLRIIFLRRGGHTLAGQSTATCPNIQVLDRTKNPLSLGLHFELRRSALRFIEVNDRA